MPAIAKTLGPLHLEDLEPHRFEDLVRQLLYDFRPWRDLEATGRTGSDEGFDARAWETVGLEVEAYEPDEEGEEALPDIVEVRQWLIQCKREKAIGPTKIEKYVDALPDPAEVGLYGLIFVAACDFSIESRNRFRERARQRGFQEIKLWAKAEIEDQLYQPKNDHLLFAYFGVSLQVRRRSLKTEIRARLAMKRKCKRHLQPYSSVLIRDASDHRYPNLDENKRLPRHERGRWKVFRFVGCGPFGVEVGYRRHFAFIDDDDEHWDFAERMDDARPQDDPWPDPLRPILDRARLEDFRQWNDLPEQNRAWYERKLVLPYEDIIDIDAEGDEFFAGPHIYVPPFTPTGMGPFADLYREELTTGGHWGRSCRSDEAKRVHVFPRIGEESRFALDEEDDDGPAVSA